MNILLYLLFLSVFLLDFCHFNLRIVPRYATWMPEVLSTVTFFIVALRFAIKKELAIHQKYIYLILSYFIIIFIGTILNRTPIGGLFIGIRFYFKHLPFFLLPAVHDFSDKEFRSQLQFLLPLLILQCPLAVYQRFVQYKGVPTGDLITGTLQSSAPLSIVMICSIAVIFALYLKKQVDVRFFLLTSCCLFLPTAIDETKATLIFLPIAFVLPALFSGGYVSLTKTKSLFTMALVGGLFISAYIPIYNHFIKAWGVWGQPDGILAYLQKEDELKKYLYRGAKGTRGERIRRGDVIVLAYKNLSTDIRSLAFGVGMGNVLDSYFRSCRGKYSEASRYRAESLGLTHLFWELGLFGVIVYAAFLFFLFRDSVLLKRSDDIFASLALGWSAVVVIMALCLVYKNTMHLNVINLMFWYFSGVVAAKAFRMTAISEGYAPQRAISAKAA